MPNARPRPLPAAARSPLEATVLHGVRALLAGMRRSARAIETSVGLSNAQLFLLEQMAAGGAQTVAQLGRRLHVRANAISMSVAKLVERGLATRTIADGDRRRVAVAITAAGRRLLRRAPAPPTTRLLAALEAMPPRDLRSLARGLKSLAGAMRLDAEHAPLMFEDEPERRARRGAAHTAR